MKRTPKSIITALVIAVAIVGGIAYIINWAFFDIQRIKGQDYLTESTSPNGAYTVTSILSTTSPDNKYR